MTAKKLRDLVVGTLEDAKGLDILDIDVSKLTPLTDYMVVASGTSNRHVRALVDQTLEAAKSQGATAIGVEGRETCEWVLVDLVDVIVHVMQKDAREFYELERLWTDMPSPSRSQI
ncbi:MAG: ribosome silencing factor [Gammaproteobacteria bacterium]|nr:ribosome silencing factor [Gammaproteobacteria bacterium]